MTVDSFFGIVAEQMLRPLCETPMGSVSRRHWLVMEDDRGVEIAEVSEGEIVIHEVISSLLERGSEAAAYVTYVPEPRERILAEVVTKDPRDSDIREAGIVRATGGQVVLQAWQRLV